MRDFVLARPWGATPMVGMGLDELRWLHPVRPGDILSIRREIVEIVRSRTKPRGVVKSRVEAANQHGQTVLTMLTLASVPRRPDVAP